MFAWKPSVTLDMGGNVMELVAKCRVTARACDRPAAEIEAFSRKVMEAQSNAAALDVIRQWFDVREFGS